MGKIGIAFAGGGARGAYQIGAWKALREYGYDKRINCVSGASVGSLNASLFAMGDYELAEKTWLNLNKDSLFHLESNIFKRVLSEKLSFFNKGIYNTDNLEELMEHTLDYDKIRSMDVYVATTFLGEDRKGFFDLMKTNYEHHFIKDHNMIKYTNLKEKDPDYIKMTILASCAIPVAFQPITIDGDTFYDGGLLDNTPIEPLLDAGCDKVLLIDLFSVNFRRMFEHDDRVYNIHPKRGLRGVLDFDTKKIKRRFELGYLDMMDFIIKNPTFFEEK